jgi:hypothetical protein
MISSAADAKGEAANTNPAIQPRARVALALLLLTAGAWLAVACATTLAAPDDGDAASFLSLVAIVALWLIAVPSLVLAIGLLTQGARWAVATGIFGWMVAICVLALAGWELGTFALAGVYGLVGTVAFATVHARDDLRLVPSDGGAR